MANAFADFAPKDSPNAFADFSPDYVKPKTSEDHARDAVYRSVQDLGSIGTDLLRTGQHAAGGIGDLLSLAGLNKGPGPRMPTSEDMGNAVSSLSEQLGGPTELAGAQTPEAKVASPIIQGAASMISTNPWVAGVGALSGVTGQIAQHLNGNDENSGVARTGGEIAGMLPLLLGLKAAPGIGPMKEAVDTLGKTKADIMAAIDRASSRANVASDVMQMPHSSLWSQLPELNPEISALRGTPQGAPLNEQVKNEAISMGMVSPKSLMKKIWDPAQGWVSPIESLNNIVQQAEATATPRTSNLIAGSKNSVIGQAAGLLNPFKWPEKAGESIGDWRGRSSLSGIAEALSGPNAAQALKKIANYSPGGNAVKLLARALGSLVMDQGSPLQGIPPEAQQ